MMLPFLYRCRFDAISEGIYQNEAEDKSMLIDGNHAN